MDIQTETSQQTTTETSQQTTTKLLTNKEQHILDNQMEIDWLKRQIERRKQDSEAYATIKENVEELGDDLVQQQLEYYLQQLESLRISMDIMAQFNVSKERIGINLDDNHYTLEAQYPQPDGDTFSDSQTLQMQDFLMKRDKLVVESMQHLEQLNETQNQLAQLHAQAIGKYQDNQELWITLETTRKIIEQQAETEMSVQTQSITTQSQGRRTGSAVSIASSQNTKEKATEKLHDVLNRLEIAKNVLMGLILESGIDWASDRKWSRVMLLIGTEEDD